MDKAYMKSALRSAEKARGKCSPNPFVGAVIVKKGKIIASGFTQEYGGNHAEIQALNKAGNQARGADMYVTLEPCSHYGKTPPCALAIIKAGIKRVYLGILDPNPLVAGKGMKLLQEAGIVVQSGIMGAEVRRQLESYLCVMNKHRPFITLKTALSADGKFAASDGSSRWISNSQARRYTHNLRSENDAILTGVKTIIIDNPLLTVRLPGQPKQPLRVVLDPFLQLPEDSQFAIGMQQFPSLIFCSETLVQEPAALRLHTLGAHLIGLPLSEEGLFDLREVLNQLSNLKLNSVLLETGSGVAESFLKAKLIDKCIFIYGAMLLGGSNSPLPNLGLDNIAEAIRLTDIRTRTMGDNLIFTAYPVWETTPTP